MSTLDKCLYFISNGGEGGASFYFIEDINISSDIINSFVYREGYVLKDWNTRADGTGITVKSEDVVVSLKNTVAKHMKFKINSSTLSVTN